MQLSLRHTSLLPRQFLYIFLLTLGLLSCTGNKPKVVIGVSQCSGGGWRDKQNSEMCRELLLHEGVSIDIRDAHDDNTQQIADIEHFIEEKYDAIIASPNTEDALTDVIAMAYDKGIPVILFDRKVKGDKYTAFVGCDNVAVGEQLANFTAKTLPEGGRVLELMGNMTTLPAQQRHQGVLSALKKYNNINLLASVDAKWDGGKAQQVIDSLLKIYPDVDMVIAHSDWMAQDAHDYVEKNFPDRKIRFVGVDGFGADRLGVYAVEKGRIDATVIYPTGGNVIISTVLDILAGKKYECKTILPSYIVSEPNEAHLMVSMENELKHEVQTVRGLRERITFYGDQLQREKTLLLSILGLLVLAVSLVVLFFRLYNIKRITNNKLREQQEELVKQRDQLLTMTTELEEANNAKLRFFTNLSHDFRTPLTLIAAPLEEMANHDDSKLINIAQRNVRVLLRLINQILDFRKFQNGQLTLDLKPANLKEYIQGWFDSFSTLATKRNITMTLMTEGDDSELLLVDIRKIERMFYNIMGNAMKFTPDGGIINVEYTRHEHDFFISITDNGEGIESKHLQRIFERFYQVDSSRYEGSGIGLALVKSFAEIMHGTINVSSNADAGAGTTGTTITLVIPAEETTDKATDVMQVSHDNIMVIEDCTEENALQPNTEVDLNEQRPVLLVIDDNADLRVMIQSVLGKQYHILTAANGKEGADIAFKNVPDLILCDVMMPVMDGMECCRLLKNDVRTCHIPVLMLTACSLDEQRVQGLAEGAEAYIAKPFSMSVLRAQIESLIRNRKTLCNFYNSAAGEEKKNTEKLAKTEVRKENLSAYDQEFLDKLLKVINDNLADESFNVETLSSMLFLSRVQIYRKCKALTGNTPVELIRNIRLDKARELLNAKHGSISAVAAAVGFADASYFSRCYKAYFGVTPREQ